MGTQPQEVIAIELTNRQLRIMEIVKKNSPITGEQIAEMIGVSRPTIRSDLSLLIMLGFLDAKPKVGYFLGTGVHTNAKSASKLSTLKVKEVQALPVIVLETTTVQDAVVTLFLENVGSLIVNNEQGMLAGIVSRKDLLKLTIGNPNAGNMLISMVMTRRPKIITVTPEDVVIDAAKKLIHYEVDSLPVVNAGKDEDHQEVVGRISKTTITKVLVQYIL